MECTHEECIGSEHTTNHVLDGFFVVFSQIYHTSLGLAELVATSTVEETRPRAQDGSVYRPLL